MTLRPSITDSGNICLKPSQNVKSFKATIHLAFEWIHFSGISPQIAINHHDIFSHVPANANVNCTKTAPQSPTTVPSKHTYLFSLPGLFWLLYSLGSTTLGLQVRPVQPSAKLSIYIWLLRLRPSVNKLRSLSNALTTHHPIYFKSESPGVHIRTIGSDRYKSCWKK